MIGKWRRFRSRSSPKSRPQTDNQDRDIYSLAKSIIDQQLITKKRFWHRHDPHAFDEIINVLRARALQTNDPSLWLATLIVQGPRAVSAQRGMDKHGYHGQKTRLYELIDFNDSYVNTVLAFDEDDLEGFNDKAKDLMDRFCHHVKSPCFTTEQWEAITHGLSREIAVFRGAINAGYEVRMTSRHEDAMGVDMTVTDVSSGLTVGIDVKTRSSFHFRLMDLHREGRISELQREQAELFGHLRVVNGHGSERVVTTLLRIDEETFGRIQNFRLERPDKLKEKLDDIIRQSHRD